MDVPDIGFGFGGTKKQEYRRSAEFFKELCGRGENGPYFALAMLLDSSYQRADLVAILTEMRPKEFKP